MEIVKAIREGNMEFLRSISKSVLNTMIPSEGLTPLGYIIRHSSLGSAIPVTKLLLDLGANPERIQEAATKKSALTFLFTQETQYAAMLEQLEILLAKGANPNKVDQGGLYPMFEVMNFKRFQEAIPILLRYKGDANVLLLKVVARNNIPLAKSLLARGATPMFKVESGGTAVHVATRYGYDKILRVLLPYVTTPDLQNTDGNTPAHLLFLTKEIEHNRDDMLILLYKKGGNVNLQNAEGKTLLHMAVEANDESSVVRLLTLGADRAVMDHHGKQPIHYANPVIRNLLLGVEKPYGRAPIISPKMYDDAIRLLESCPTGAERFFINTSEANCWMDSVMIAITFCDDLGKTLRAVLVTYLSRCKRNGYHHPEHILEYISTWRTENSLRTYMTRMILLLLLGSERAQEWLSCPLAISDVRKFAWKTQFDFKEQDYDNLREAGIVAGGFNYLAAIRFLSPLFSENILIKQKYIPVAGRKYPIEEEIYDFNGTSKEVLNEKIKTYSHRLSLYTMTRKDGKESMGHATSVFQCGDKLFFYDNNTGLYLLPGTVFPHFISYKQVIRVGTTYTFDCESSQIILKHDNPRSGDVGTYEVSYIYEIWGQNVYNLLRDNPERLKMNSAHTPPKPFTPPIKRTIEEEIVHDILTSRNLDKVSSKLYELRQKGQDVSFAVGPAIQMMNGLLVYKLVYYGTTYNYLDVLEVSHKTNRPTIRLIAEEKLESEIRMAERRGNSSEVARLKAILAKYSA
jgi:26S proteasome non-ATPase regulatory subunit 10